MQKRSGGPDLGFSGLAYCVAFNSRKAARAVTRLYDSALAPVGVRSTQLAVLIALARSEPLSIGSLAEILSVKHYDSYQKPSADKKTRAAFDLGTISNAATLCNVDSQGDPRSQGQYAALARCADSFCESDRREPLEGASTGTRSRLSYGAQT